MNAEDKEYVENWHKNTQVGHKVICPIVSECIHPEIEGCVHNKPHKYSRYGCTDGACFPCIPYEPEKEKTDWENLWAFFRDNKASKAIETGYKCSHCGWWVIYDTVHFCPVKKATFYVTSGN
jgi:hypothetical protein